MTLQIIQGNLFDAELDFAAIAHGVNCKGVMGAGIAAVFRANYPDMYDQYASRCFKFDASLAGLLYHYQPKPVILSRELSEDGLNYDVEVEFPTSVYNLFTQVYPGANADYGLIEKAAIGMRFHAEESWDEARIGLPWIGCGIGGLQKHNVQHILSRVLDDSDIDFFIVEQ